MAWAMSTWATESRGPLWAVIAPDGTPLWLTGRWPLRPAISTLTRADRTSTVIVNTGCWLRQLQPVPAWLGAPPVFVPAFVHSHVRVRPGQGGLTVELWEHPKPAQRQPWLVRIATSTRP